MKNEFNNITSESPDMHSSDHTPCNNIESILSNNSPPKKPTQKPHDIPTYMAEDVAFTIKRSDTQYSSNKRRIVVTGIGIISPNGTGKSAFWTATKQGISGIKKISQYDTSHLPIKIAGEVTDFTPENYFDRKQLRYLDRFSQFSLAACQEAVDDSRYPVDKIRDNPYFGVYVGTAVGPVPLAETESHTFFRHGLKKVPPLLSTKLFPGTGASHIAIKYGLHQDVLTLSTGCTSSTDAISMAYREIKRGNIDAAIAGGAESPLSPLCVNSFHRIGIASKNFNNAPHSACRPFEKNRDGIIVSEGAGMFVFEELSHAKRRGAPIYGEVIGCATSHDAFHITEPSDQCKHYADAMNQSLLDAEVSRDKVGAIFAHGNSVPLGDLHETKSIKYLFGKHAYKLKIPALESMVGHPFGASGALKFGAGILSLKEQFLFPTINLNEVDPECDLNFVPNKGERSSFKYALVNSSSFGGKYSVLAIKQLEETLRPL